MTTKTLNHLLLFFLFFCLLLPKSGFADDNYRLPVKIISKSESNYLSPENTYYSINSCLLAEDLEWCDEAMTRESLARDIELFDKAGIDRSKEFELQKSIKESFVIDKFDYDDTIILMIEDHGHSGSISIMPLTFVLEDGLWKLTNKFSSDPEVNKHFYYVPPLFYGKGGRPADVNTFLGYEQPTQARTELAPGATSYTVHVYYGRTVAPATFSAELNREDISGLFSPEPFTDEEVDIPLQPGRNTLALSIEGIRNDGKTARDTDRLVFIVP
ncbi:hypothetical protein ACHHRT_13750 [Desulfurivibrio sp. D14AmB]|uniref:hypothetical protein n=1 Tax=Desulfurivibrio sp. D14AmB TaxID=3374370 RepID=UPI00376EA4EA